ncbi:MAG: aminoacyl-histidine dipeptidase [Chitinivibrionales bacterium]|nr:aminoacyl-histidine dipeptidase [Chitinivibrionales bacterium]
MASSNDRSKKVLSVFEQISKVPRRSKSEDKIRDWLLQWAKDNKLTAHRDAPGNVVIQVPASAGFEKSPTIVFQSHMDMVCEKTPESPHDFTKDPIKLIYEGDLLKADNTTLGADNGIGMALGMVFATDKTISHPPLELLFTVDEETGLTGASALEAGFIKGKILINVDSEDEGVFTIGCAGGKDVAIEMPLEYTEVPQNYTAFKIKASGMFGGHSGVNINEQRANAIKIMVRTLHEVLSMTDLRLIHMEGGTAHNAIPRDCVCTISIPQSAAAEVTNRVSKISTVLNSEYKNTDPSLAVTIERFAAAPDNRAMSQAVTRKVLNLILALPHGVSAMSLDMKGLVETSCNCAIVRVENGTLKMVTSQRSSVMSRLHALTHRIEAIVELSGANYKTGQGYPSWQPNVSSPLLARCKDVYKKLFNKEPVVEAIHAGLECGIIGSKISGMDMISVGPTIKNPHSPNEYVNVPSIGKVVDFLIELLKSFK